MRRLDPVASPWLLDHRPNYLKAAFPMAGVAETLLDLPADETGRPIAVERLELSRWIIVDDHPMDLLLREKKPVGDGRMAFDVLTRQENDETVLSGRATLVRAANLPQPPVAWALPKGAAVAEPYEEGGLFHDGLFCLVEKLRETDRESVFEIALERVWAHPEAARTILFDAFLHGIPHARPSVWFGAATKDCSIMPYRLENLTIYADIPRKGVADVVSRAIDMPTPRTARAAVQMQIAGQVVMSAEITEAMLSTPGRLQCRDRRAFYRHRRAAPGWRLSRSTPESTLFSLRELKAVEWMPGTVEHLYDVTGDAREKVEAVALKEHLATPLGLHPAAIRIEAGQACALGQPPFSLDRLSRRWLDDNAYLVSDISLRRLRSERTRGSSRTWRAIAPRERTACVAKKASEPMNRTRRKIPDAIGEPFDGGVDLSIVAALAKIAGHHDLSEVEIEHDGLRVRVARERRAPAQTTYAMTPGPVPASAEPSPPIPTAPADHPGAVKSPMVGTAYLRASPEAKPFVEVGSIVKAGDKVLLVEAMKTFNEIVAPKAGKVLEILVEDGSPVEYGQPLMVIE